ncbi:YhcH/YjgK/YiaL family protein [Enterobacteriaceae bacterium H20N1]|uniref:YhcH/YjgK/YiaL family protein n=1 Tax=Dryocola boscaweniae TaxID=2925397 RepID=A0A9X3ABC6_9ENTR|nr:YhcH/YjgK/YiaL family protein [Dryocola boscaweniae]MCT4700683.1 YhcH/YjgK/YiaL family protein [Dryocola boscaweniae]MCT4716171.1 YhcH/YjgK/YiaL family protein [Dryocola boscaweniae]MCT4717903.1 YhcH/YjgK/YiaL family protein [Dryocola boscaweniae]
MIIDKLNHAAHNPVYPQVIRHALQAIIANKPQQLANGKYPIEGELIYFSVFDGKTKPLEEQRPELHARYIDVHILLEGEELIGAATLEQQQQPDGEFDEQNDIGFFKGMGCETLIKLLPGELVILFPGELHRPMATPGAPAALRKIVAKIDVDLIKE